MTCASVKKTSICKNFARWFTIRNGISTKTKKQLTYKKITNWCMTHKIDLRITIWKTKELAADGERVWIPFSGLTLWILRTKTDAKKRSVPLSSSTEDSSSVIFLQCYKNKLHKKKKKWNVCIHPTRDKKTKIVKILKTGITTPNSGTSTDVNWLWKPQSVRREQAVFYLSKIHSTTSMSVHSTVPWEKCLRANWNCIIHYLPIAERLEQDDLKCPFQPNHSDSHDF